jgi:hypothetical protein
MIAPRVPAVALLLGIGVLSPAAAQVPAQNAAPADIEGRIKDLEGQVRALEARVFDVPVLEGRVGALESEIHQLQAQTPSRQELDARLSDLEKKLKGDIDKTGQSPWLVGLPIGVSLGSLLVAALTFRRTGQTRTEDLRSAEQQRQADLSQIEARRRKDLSDTLYLRWSGLHDRIAELSQVLVNEPQSLTLADTQQRSLLERLGNEFNFIAGLWDEADESRLVTHGMDEMIRTFWRQFQSAKAVLQADPATVTYLQRLGQDWPSLAALVGRLGPSP